MSPSLRFTLAVLVASLALAAACGPSTPASNGATSSPTPLPTATAPKVVTIADLQLHVFSAHCVDCHNTAAPEGHLDLSEGRACAAIVRQPSCLFNGRTLVVPGDAANSFAFAKVEGTDLGGTPDAPCNAGQYTASHRMPEGGAPLDPDDVQMLETWINAGASCETTEPTPTPTATATPMPTATPPAAGKPRLAEVLYDATGSDDGLEWVLLANDSGAPIDLSTYSLGAGRTAWTYTTASLAGTIPAHGCFLVGGPTSSAANGTPAFDQAFHFSPNLPNPGTSGATGVALFDAPASTLSVSSMPLDSVVFGATNNGLIGADGAVHAPDLAAGSAGQSARRAANGTWAAQAPAPSVCPAL